MPYSRLPPPPQRNAATPEEELKVVVATASTTRTYILQSWKQQTHHHGDSAFPIAIFCQNKFDVRDAQTVCAMLVGLSQMSLERQLQSLIELECASSYKDVLTKPFGFYTVMDNDNGYEFLCRKWPDVYPFVKDAPGAFCKGHENLGAALKYILARGLDPDVAIRRHIELAQLASRMDSMAMGPPPLNTPRSTPARPTPAGSAARTPSRTASRASNNRASSGAEGVHTSMRGRDDANLETGDTPRTQRRNRAARPVDIMPFLHERDIRGNIVRSHFVPFTFAESAVPTLGDFLDDYVDSARLPDAFITAVHSSYIASQTRDDFAKGLSNICSFQEAYFLWRWIDTPSDGSAELRTRDEIN